MNKRLLLSIAFALTLILPGPTLAQSGSVSETYNSDQLVETGNEFFGSIAQGLASLIEAAIAENGLPNAYILGEEGSGAIIAGARFGEGTMYTRNAGQRAVYWQGPSIGFDFGGDGSRVMMLVYNLPTVDSIYGRYPGVNGSAYVVGGLGMTAMKYEDILILPIRSGLGARLGVNVGYLKFTAEPTWNPF
jgi:hypothetical protein